MFKVLQRQKAPSRLIIFPEENQSIAKWGNAQFFFNEVFAWVLGVNGPDEANYPSLPVTI